MIFSENRYPPRIKCGAGFFRIMLLVGRDAGDHRGQCCFARNFRGAGTLPCTAQPRPKGEMPNESFSADRCRRSWRIGDNTHATGRGDADVAAGTRRCANRRRYRSGTRRPRSWSRAYGARRSWPSLRLGQRPWASLWMVTRQTSRLGLNPISPFAVVALVATTPGVKVGVQGPSGQQFGRRSIVASFSTVARSRA